MLLFPLISSGTEKGELCLACHPRHYGEQGGCSSCHRGNPSSRRPNVAHQGLVAGQHARFMLQGDSAARQGERLAERLGCRRCHVIAARGNRLAANLDQAAVARGSAALVAALKNPAAAMPDFHLAKGEIDLLVNLLYAFAAKRGGAEQPVAVHFRRDGSRDNDPFSLKCGPCHRVLSSSIGAAGRGSVAPDLSGLFTPFYPDVAAEGKPWTVRRLAQWLENPRELRRWSVMRPVSVTAAELEEIAAILALRQTGTGRLK